MTAETAWLYISFWHIGLENLPEGTIGHRRIPTHEAKQLIDEARAAGRLRGVSNDDLLAPYHEHEAKNHEALRAVLHDHCGISLSFEDFALSDNEDGEDVYSVHPLVLVEVADESRMLVVNCSYSLRDRPKEARKLEFDIAPDSVTFHLFEVAK